MMIAGPMRTVVAVERSWHHVFLTLACGHVEHREDNRPLARRKTTWVRARCRACSDVDTKETKP